jgi:hypothetical protein
MNDFSSQTAVVGRMRSARLKPGKTYYTDQQLCDRWHCSKMKLWRLRQQGLLRGTFKLGGVGPNLTPEENVEELEGQT